MADEAAVTLSADDQISAPVLRATAALQQLQAAIEDISTASTDLSQAGQQAAAGVDQVASSTNSSLGPHRAAHQALSLVSSDLVNMAGGSAAAQSGVRILDSIMFQMAVTGGAVSLGLIAIVAAAAGVGAAMKSSSDDTKAQQAALDKMTESAVKAVSQLNYLDAAQKSVAGVGGAQLQTRIVDLKTQIAELTEKMNENAAAQARGVLPSFGATMMAGLKAGFTGGEAKDTVTEESNAAQIKMAGNLRALQEELKKAQTDQTNLTKASAEYKSTLVTISDPLNQMSRALDLSAADTEAVGHALGDVSASMGDVADMANKMGVSYVQAAGVMSKQTQTLGTEVIDLSKTIGTSMGNAILGAKDAWKEGLKTLIAGFFDAATAIVTAAAIMNQAISAALIPGTFVGILAMVAVLQAMKAIAVGALTSSQSSANSAGAASVSGISASGASSGSGSAAPSGPGGTAVSSAQSQVTNNITVNLPVQALDLSSISDMQLKSLATRVGQVIAEAAGQGQFSLVGA